LIFIFPQALEIVREAEKEDNESPQTMFLLHKIHLLMNQDEQGN